MDSNLLRTIFTGWNLIWILNLMHSVEGLTVSMHQIDEGPRSVGSCVTLESRVSNGSGALTISMFVQYYEETEVKRVGYLFYPGWTETMPKDDTDLNTNISYLNLSVSIADNYTRIVTWEFSTLPAKCDKLLLRTSATDMTAPEPREFSLNLTVLECNSLVWEQAFDQNATYNITADSDGHYNYNGTCECNNGGTLFYPSGDLAKAQAICSRYANWSGCEIVQCWTGPQNIIAQQLEDVAGALNPFTCNFDPGFPDNSVYQLKIGYTDIQPEDALKSYDNGKILSCQVTSNYTIAMGETATSPNVTITVYYPPEHSNVSENDIVMLVNYSRVVNFSFSANPKSGVISVYISGKTLSSYEWGKNSSDGTIYNYELIFNWTSSDEYGTYELCANTSNPEGSNCTSLTIRNGTVATTMIPDSTGTAVLPIAIVAPALGALILLLAICAGVVYLRRRNLANTKEERINEIYEASPNQGPSNEANGTAADSYREMKMNEAYEASPQQPEIQDVYTTVDRDRKGKGKTDRNSSEDQSTTSVEQTTPAVLDVYAVVKK